MTDPPAPSGAPAPRWFRYLLPFLKAPEDLTPHQWRLLGLLGITVLINHYDFGLLGAALLQIQQELHIPEDEIGGVYGLIRMGVVAAMLLAVVADRLGRRRLLLWTILGFTGSTILTAFAQTQLQFTVLQFVARVFVTAEELVAVVVIAEELGARRRGFALGILAALGSLGHGLAYIGFGFIETLPYGWRSLYLMGAAPLLFIAWIRRSLPETRRFEQARQSRQPSTGLAAGLQPLWDLVRKSPRRVAVLSLVLLPASAAMIPASSFAVKFLQESHGWAPSQIPLLTVGGGFLVFASMALTGSVADRFGRRRLLVAALLMSAGGVAVFYNSPGLVVVPGWILMTAGLVSADVIFGALGSELFPTSYRTTASGLRALLWTLGGSIGLFLEGWLYNTAGGHAAALSCLLLLAWIAPLAVLVWIPETAGRELEEIAPELASGG
jgi:putative MFS transporter